MKSRFVTLLPLVALLVSCVGGRLVQMDDVDQRVFIPVFTVYLEHGDRVSEVSLPYVAKKKGELCTFRFELSLPDTLMGQAIYLAVSVDDHAEVFLGDSLVGKVRDVGEVFLKSWEAGLPLTLRLRCWADAEPTRLRGVWVIARPARNRKLREAEHVFSRLRALARQPYTSWEWARGDTSGKAWAKTGFGTSWSGKGAIAWFRTLLTKPGKLNNLSTAGDSLWLHVAVDDSAVVFVDGQPVAFLRRSGNVALPQRWHSGAAVPVKIKIINFRGPGRFVGAWLVSSSVTALGPSIQELLSEVATVRELLEQHPNPKKEWVEIFLGAAAQTQELLNTRNLQLEELRRKLERIRKQVADLDRLAQRYPPLVCAPYLQNVQTDAITVMWETAKSCVGTVHYRKADGSAKWVAVSEKEARRIHEVCLSGLKADSEYEYWVQNENGRSGLARFRTAPDKPRPFRFAVWGDSRSDPYSHETVILQMLKHKPEIAINVGDVVGRGANVEEWPLMHFRPMRWLARNTPTFIAIGNHEYGGFGDGNPVPPFEHYVSQPSNEYYFSFDYGGSHFIVLDSNVPEEDGIPLGRKQFEWLKKDLASEASHRANWRFVFLHHPPYSEAWDWGGYYDGEELFRQKLVPLFEENAVTAVFSGHTHDYERGQWPKGEGPYYIITGGGGAELDNLVYRDWPQIDVQEFAYHFCLLEVSPDSIRFQAIRHNGSVLDRFVIRK